MISTVTTTTVTSVYTAASLGLVIAVALLCLLIQKEMTSVSQSRWGKALNQVLTVAITPLLIGFGLLLVLRVFDMLK
jgi:hypothetical protein